MQGRILIYFSFCFDIRSFFSQEVKPQASNYPLQVPGSCSNAEYFDCGGGQCIPFSNIRDCTQNCPNGSDENCGIGLSLCDAIQYLPGCGKCVVTGSESSFCQDRRYVSFCNSLSDAYHCSTTQNCIPKSWVLNGQNECGDFSDENSCILNGSFCGSGSASCSFNVYTMKATCPCSDRTSDVTCAPPTNASTAASKVDILSRIPGSCRTQPLQFDCGDGLCVPIEKFRDCNVDCPDGSDEACWTGQVKCDGCKCVYPAEQINDCSDAQTICPSSEMFRCLSGGCVYDEMVLDGTKNCVDGSDENFCSTALTNCPLNQPCMYAPLIHSFQCGCPSGTVPLTGVNGTCRGIRVPEDTPKDCADYQTQTRPTGSATITVNYPSCTTSSSCSTIQILCDFDLHGGGWTVIQLRKDGSVDFDRSWSDYKAGFGIMNGEFWLGNEYVYQLTGTSGMTYELLIILTSEAGAELQVRYDRFQLSSESDFYRLTLGSMIRGDTDNLVLCRGQRFGTKDTDPNNVPGSSTCGSFWGSGWWHETTCLRTGNLNVPYEPVPDMAQLAGILWTGTVKSVRMVITKIMIRPLGFKLPPLTTSTSRKRRTFTRPGTPRLAFNSQKGASIHLPFLLFAVLSEIIVNFETTLFKYN